MTRSWLFALATVTALAACNKPSTEECRKALINIRTLMGTEDQLRTTDLNGDIRRCKGGSTKKAVACAAAAKSLDELRACDFMKVPSKKPDGSGTAGSSAGGSTGSSAAGSATGSADGSAGGSAAGSAGGSTAGSAGDSAAGSAGGSTAGGSAAGSAAGSAGGSAAGSAGGSAGSAATGSATTGSAGGAPSGSAGSATK